MSTFTESVRTWEPRALLADRRATVALGVIGFAVATAFSAQVAVRLPWTPVPVTLQPLFVILAGAILGARGGAISMAAYVTVGALGWPVFSNGGAGIGWLLGPTGGYLLAAPAAAYIAGSLSQVQRAAWVGLLGLSLGVATMYAGGVLQLMAVTGRPLAEAFALGAVPFFVGDVTKVVLAFLVLLASRRVRRAEG